MPRKFPHLATSFFIAIVSTLVTIGLADPPADGPAANEAEREAHPAETTFPQPWKLVVRRKGVEAHEYRLSEDESIFRMVFEKADAQDGIVMMILIAAVSKDRPFDYVATNHKLSIDAEERSKIMDQLPEKPEGAAYDVAMNVRFFKDKPPEDVRAQSIASFRSLWMRQNKPLIESE